MRISAARYALSGCVAAALLSGCGSTSQPALGSERGESWMLSEAKSAALLYVATGDNVYVLSYPNGKLVGNLGVAGNNLCSDRNGDIFVPTGGYAILEYAHGGTKPIQTLFGGDIPLGCAVDPTTGNLAVTQEGSGAGEVAIFSNAQGTPTWYRDPDIYTYGLCGYDDSGNLFVDGNGTGNYLAELPKGNNTFRNYSLDNNFDVYGAVQWDGKRITLSNPSSYQIYRLKFGKTSFKVIGTTPVDGWHNSYSGHWPYIQTWLQSGTFIAQSSSLAQLGLWHYPRGGSARRVLSPFNYGTVNIYGVTVSIAPGR